jgi:hypothetical protein
MKFKTLLLTTALLCAGCGTTPSDLDVKTDKLVVPAVKQYTPAQQDQAATEMENFCDKVPMLCQMVNDFGRMRDQARAALGMKVDVER